MTRALVDPGVKGPKISREACFKEGEKSSGSIEDGMYQTKGTQVVRKRILRPTGEG